MCNDGEQQGFLGGAIRQVDVSPALWFSSTPQSVSVAAYRIEATLEFWIEVEGTQVWDAGAVRVSEELPLEYATPGQVGLARNESLGRLWLLLSKEVAERVAVLATTEL